VRKSHPYFSEWNEADDVRNDKRGVRPEGMGETAKQIKSLIKDEKVLEASMVALVGFMQNWALAETEYWKRESIVLFEDFQEIQSLYNSECHTSAALRDTVKAYAGEIKSLKEKYESQVF